MDRDVHLASNDIRHYFTATSNKENVDVNLGDFLLHGGDTKVIADLVSRGFSTVSPRSVVVSVSDAVEDSACRKM